MLSAWDNVTWDDDDNRTAEHVRQLLTDDETVDEGVGTYGYDMSGRMTQSKHPFEEDAVAYGLDDAGNIVTETDFAYTYLSNRLISRQTLPPGLTWSYAHDAYGNQVSESVGTMTTTTGYDAGSRSRRVTSSDGSWVEYAYDALDQVVRRHESTGAVVLFFHDASSSQIALETDAAGTVTTRYILDSDGQPLGNETIGTGGRGWFIEDPRGNVSQLVDGSGVVKATFSYDPFGKEKTALTSKVAGWDSRLRFQAAPRDPKTGMYTLGPRLLDPSINRFVGADNYVGAAANMELALDPLTGNRYLYAGANPANLVDDGHDPSVAQSSLDTFLHELTKFANEAIAHCKKKRGHCVNDRFIRQAAKSIAGLDPGRWVVGPEGPRRVAPPGEIQGESGWKASLIDGDNSPARHFRLAGRRVLPPTGRPVGLVPSGASGDSRLQQTGLQIRHRVDRHRHRPAPRSLQERLRPHRRHPKGGSGLDGCATSVPEDRRKPPPGPGTARGERPAHVRQRRLLPDRRDLRHQGRGNQRRRSGE